VPKVSEAVYACDKLITTANQLADTIDGLLTDDQRRPLTDAGIQVIRTRIGEIQNRMSAHQLPSGGRRALRLFR